MVGRQQSLRVGAEGRGCSQGLGQAASVFARRERAASEQQRGPLRGREPLRRGGDGSGVRSRGRGRSGRRNSDTVRGQFEHVDGNLDVHRTRTSGADHREGALDHGRKFFGPQQRVAERGHVPDDGTLIGELVQTPLTHPKLMALVHAGNHHHRHRVPVGLSHCGSDVGHAGAGDDEAGGGTAGSARETVGHEARALFVARRNVTDAGPGEPAIEFDGVHAGDAEDVVNAVRFKELGERRAACGHG